MTGNVSHLCHMSSTVYSVFLCLPSLEHSCKCNIPHMTATDTHQIINSVKKKMTLCTRLACCIYCRNKCSQVRNSIMFYAASKILHKGSGEITPVVFHQANTAWRQMQEQQKKKHVCISPHKPFALVPSVLHYSDLKYFVSAQKLACIAHGRRLARISVSIHFVIFLIYTVCAAIYEHSWEAHPYQGTCHLAKARWLLTNTCICHKQFQAGTHTAIGLAQNRT